MSHGVLRVDQEKVGACRQALASNPGLGPMGGLHPGFSGAGCPHSPLPAGLMDACRECGARALELMRKLQDPEAMQQAQPGLARPPLQDLLQLAQVMYAAMALSVPGCIGGQLWAMRWGQSTHHQSPEHCCPSLFPRLPEGLLGVEGTLSDPWMPSSSRC